MRGFFANLDATDGTGFEVGINGNELADFDASMSNKFGYKGGFFVGSDIADITFCLGDNCSED